jgi:hypothetical protein
MRDLTLAKLSNAMIRAIRRAEGKLADLSEPVGLRPNEISAYLHGRTFGAKRRQRLSGIAERLGVPVDKAFVVVRRVR